MLSDVGGEGGGGERGLASVLNFQSLFFFKESWICAMTGHAESSNTLMTRYLIDPDIIH